MRLPAAFVASALVLTLGGCGWVGRADDTSKPDGFPLRGYVSVTGAAAGTTGTPCLASVTDIAAGAEVRAADPAGAVVATTTLGGGVLAQEGPAYRCNFPFEFPGVSGARPTYRIMVADRPAVSFETARLREGAPAIIPVLTASTSPS